MQRKKEEKLYAKNILKSWSVHFILRFLYGNLGNTETSYTKLKGYMNPWQYYACCIVTHPTYFCYRLVSILILFLLHK